MAHFIEVPLFDIFDESTGEWAAPEHFWLSGRMLYQSDLLGEDGQPVLVEVPSGFYTDFASLPRWPSFIRSIFIKNGTHRPAAVPHDWLCRLGLEFPRVLADKIFLEAMKVCGVKRVHRRLMYWAVRINTERLILVGKARRMEKTKP